MDREKDHRKIPGILFTLSLFLALTGWWIPSPSVVAQKSNGYSIRFYGNGYGDIDRIKIPLKSKLTVNVGSADFTIEWWMKANPADNLSTVRCNENDGWIYGNILFDRDVWGEGDYGDFGIALNEGRIAFGVNNGKEGNTLCGTKEIADGKWHHVAVTRVIDSGTLTIFVDGALDVYGEGPMGDISYRVGRSTQYPDDPFLVIGAEKHDAGTEYPSFKGWIDEVRVSIGVRYREPFSLPAASFILDGATVALFHFDEGPVGPCMGELKDETGANTAFCQFGGSSEQGPVFTEDNPFSFIRASTSTVTLTQTIRGVTSTPFKEIIPTTIATSTVEPQRTREIFSSKAVPVQVTNENTEPQPAQQGPVRPPFYLILSLSVLLVGIAVLLLKIRRRKGA